MDYFIMRQKTMKVKGGPIQIEQVPANFANIRWAKVNSDLPSITGAPLMIKLSEDSGTFKGSIIDGLMLIYKKKLIEQLKAFGAEDFFIYPVALDSPHNDEIISDYYAIKITQELDCIDMEKSKIQWWSSKKGFDFHSMIIDKEKTNEQHLFRLKEDPTKVIISQTLKSFLEESKALSGVKLTLTSEYSDF